ncbi:MAG TPA: zinc ribbon domain-containing protein [Candidatus Acidoferrales bacterium]|jgi:RNA polymerase subunit RPABC4/transcription elongation factor Spt4|nr:zinc ribbon domain-containing protein [Candidatus Acidoferrales bacterium]
MSRFTDGLKIVPRTAWVIASVCYVGFVTLALTVMIPGDNEMKNWPFDGKLAFAFGIFLFVYAWILLIGYVYADAKRRGMRYAMWTWLAALIPNAIGIILYFILRDPLPRPCPGCSRLVKSGFVFCPHCGTAMKPTCPNCGRAVEHGWANCPECGSKLPAVTTTPRTA